MRGPWQIAFSDTRRILEAQINRAVTLIILFKFNTHNIAQPSTHGRRLHIRHVAEGALSACSVQNSASNY